MLLRGGGPEGANRHFPFNAPDIRSFYFARNAIWWLARWMGLDQGEVLVPAYHHGVEVEALVDAGAGVRFYRIGPRWEVDLEDVESKIGPRTRALYLTHFAGFPGPAREMKQLAARHGLPLIEDCALALFSSDGDRPLGVTGDVSIFCVYKALATTDGGILVINDRGLAARLSSEAAARVSPPLSTTLSVLSSSVLRNVALRGGPLGRGLRRFVLGFGKAALRASSVDPILTGTQHFNRDHVSLGMSRLTSHLLRGQDVSKIIGTRRRNYLFLLENLRDLSPPFFDALPEGVVPLCYPMRVDDNKRVADRLVARGIEAVDFWREGHPACDASLFPEAAALRTTLLEVPCHQDLTLATLARVAAEIRRAVREPLIGWASGG